MRKLLCFILIGLVAVSMVAIVVAETTAQVSDEVKELQKAVEYDWHPADPSRWFITTKYKKEPPYTIALSTNHMAVTWMDIYKAEMVDELEGYGDAIKEFIHVDAGGDIPAQIANIEDLISRKVDAIIIDPASPTALVPAVEKAYDAGIVTIVNKSGINTDKYTAFQNNDEVQFGQLGAQWLVDQLGGKGIVLGLRGIPGYGVDGDDGRQLHLPVFQQASHLGFLSTHKI